MSKAVGIVVLGMGRSGTSAVTRMFTSTGFFAGRQDDLMPATEANPTGHWENLGVWRAKERVLEKLAGSWFDPPSASAQLAAREWAVPLLRSEVDRLLSESGHRPVAIKDPRINVMMPLWGAIIWERFHPVLVIRHPVEIALSLQRRDGTPPMFALGGWELHMTTLLAELDGRQVAVAPYARLIEDERVAKEQTLAELVQQIDQQREPSKG